MFNIVYRESYCHFIFVIIHSLIFFAKIDVFIEFSKFLQKKVALSFFFCTFADAEVYVLK